MTDKKQEKTESPPNKDEPKESFHVLDALGDFIGRAKKKIVTTEDEKEGGITGAIGRMGVGGMMGDMHKPLVETDGPQIKTVDVLIVGAGLAGLTAAYNIHKVDKGVTMVVLEAKDRLGGRLHTKEMKAKGGIEFYDFGWQWIGSSHKNMLQLVDKLELQTYEQYREGKIIFHKGGEEGQETSLILERDVKPFGPMDNYDYNSLINKLENLRKTIPLHDPTGCKNAKEYDTTTLQHFIDANTWFEAPRHYFETLIMITMGVSPREMSLLFFLFALSSAGGWESLFGSDDGCAKQFRIKGGSQRICDILASKIGGSKVITNDPVASIDQTDHMLVHVKTTGGVEYKADKVIVAVPPKYASRIEFNPPMSAERHNYLERMPNASSLVFVITYQEAFWRKDGLSGEILRVVDEDLAKTDRNAVPFSFVMDATSMNDNPALMGYVHAPFWLTEPDLDRRDAILVGLKGFFGNGALDFLQYAEVDWSNEPYISCHPFCAMTPGAITNYFHSLVKTYDRYASQYTLPEYLYSLRNPQDRVHWAGAETAAVWYGHMDGAVASGKRAAKEVMAHVRPEVSMSHMDED